MASKNFKIASTTTASATNSAPQKLKPYDRYDNNPFWICQNSTEEQLQSKRSNVGAGNISLSENPLWFNEICCLSDLTILDNGSGVANTFVKFNATFDKTCLIRQN